MSALIRNEDIEELLELCWTAAEDGLVLDRRHLPSQLLCFLPYPMEESGEIREAVIDTMVAQGLLAAHGSSISLTEAGRTRAETVVRRHRLTEVLLHSVLDVSEASLESTACQVEHILNPEVTDAVCTFLGHPPSCPHGRSIPGGPCCQAAIAMVEPLIVPLGRLVIGEEAVVAFVHTKRHAYLHRLAAFGLVPARRIRVRQIHPSLVVQLGETELALDQHAGREIFVKRRHSAWPGQHDTDHR